MRLTSSHRPGLGPWIGFALLLVACREERAVPSPDLTSVATFDGRSVLVPRHAVRILPANSSATSFVVALVERERIAAIPTQAFDYAAAPLVRAEWEPDRVFSEYLGEDVLAFEPDLVVTHPWQNTDTTELLESSGTPVLKLPDPNDYARLVEIVEVLGRTLDCRARADELVADLERRRVALAARGLPRLRVLSYTNYGSGGFCAGRETTVDLMLELAGLENAAGDRAGHQPLSFEELFALDPDLILVGSAEGSETKSPTASFLREAEGLSVLRAIRDGRIIVLPARLFTANSQYVIDAAERLADEVEAQLEGPAAAPVESPTRAR